ncbi:TIGR02757 family protein [Aureispira anguillae]|nr:TIGR02757 family protein [Aureispira anguillae]
MLKELLEEKVQEFNQTSFISNDPISLPHQFTQLQDIEIIGFWVAMLAWGRRTMIINSGKKLIELMDGAPHDFIVNHQEKDRARFLSFKHRTFQPLDTLYFLEFLQAYYQKNTSLELAFSQHINAEDETIEKALIGFHDLFFSLPDAPHRTRKHIATPKRKSTCKRLCMFLRWMVRKDNKGVDFGLWNHISPSQLLMPLDVHVDRIGRRYGLIQRKQTDWKTVLELTNNLRQFDPLDPVKFDFALFGIGVLEKDSWA